MISKNKNVLMMLLVSAIVISGFGAYLITRENKAPTQAANAYTATFSLNPSANLRIQPGQTFAVNPTVSLGAGGSAYGVQADLRYDQNYFELVSYAKPASKCTYEGPSINTPGRLTLILGCYAPNPLTSSDGNFSLATVIFKSKAIGTSSINLEPYNPANSFTGSWADLGGEPFNVNSVSATQGSLAVNVISETVNDITAPQIFFNNFKDGDKVKANTTLSISATDDGGVSGMELYVDGVKKASSNTSMITFSCKSLKRGTHNVRVVARDLSNNVAEKTATIKK